MVASFVMAVLLVFCWIPKADAGWVLYFRNGSSVEVSSYKEVGGVVSYPRFGGTVSVSKSEILRIEATGVDANRHDEAVEVQKQQTAAEEEQDAKDAKRRRAERVENQEGGVPIRDRGEAVHHDSRGRTVRRFLRVWVGESISNS